MPIYMKFPGVEGTAKGCHKGWIELESVVLGVNRHVTSSTAAGDNREASAPPVSEIVVSKAQDIASTNLYRQSAHGMGQKVIIDFVATDSKNGVPYMSLELENVLITNHSISGHGGTSNSVPMETMTLSATKMTYSSKATQASKEREHVRDRAAWDLATARSQ